MLRYPGRIFVVLRHLAKEVDRAIMRDAMFTVYVLYKSFAKRTYTGQTEHINRRLKEHNDPLLGGFTTRYRGEWVLIYSKSVATRSEALKREKQLKSGNGRQYIKQFIPI